MAPYSIEDLYIAKLKSEAEVQDAIQAPSSKEGKEKGSALLTAADAFLKKQDTEQALRSVREAMAIFRDQGADEMEALAMCVLARVRTGGAFNLEAMQAANRALKIFKELGETKGQAAALYVAAEVTTATSAGDAAWKATEAHKLFKQLGEKAGEAATLGLMARCYCAMQDFKKGLPVAQDAVAAFRKLGDGFREADCETLRAKMHLGLSEFNMALQAGKDALAKYQELGASALEALDVIIAAFEKMGSTEDAVFSAKQEAERARERGETEEEAAMCLKIAELQFEAGNLEQALGPSADASKLFRSAGKPKGETEAIVLHARILHGQKEKAEALKLLSRATDVGKEAGPVALDPLVSALDLTARIHAEDKNWQTAFDGVIQANNYFKGINERKGEASTLVLIAQMQVGIKDTNSAVTTMKSAPPIFRAAGAKKEEAKALATLSQMHFSRNENTDALTAAQEAMAIFNRLGEKASEAEAAQSVAISHFALASKGNAREAIKAAETSVAYFRKSGSKVNEAGTLSLLANAQLMNQSYAEAQRTARSAESIFRDLDDMDGQAGALLIIAGSHLGLGEFAESKDVAKEARSLFQETSNGKGEDGADEFLEALKQYDSGVLNPTDFMGFAMGSRDPAEAKQQSSRKKAQERKRDTSVLSNVDLFIEGPKGEKLTVTYFDAFEARRAQAPTRGPAARRASEAAGGAEEESAKAKQDAVTFSIRLMPKYVEGEEVPEKKELYHPIDIEDRRINMPVELGQPSAKYPGNVGKTNRMFAAMGDQRGLA